MRVAALLLTVLLLAGCSGPAADSKTGATDGPLLQGYVFDQAVRPVVGALVSVQGIGVANGTVRTATDGHYSFFELPVDERLVVTIQSVGLKSLSKQLSLSAGNSTFLNFTLEAVPLAKPYTEPQGFNGFLACEVATTASGETSRQDCGSTENKRVWTLAINPGVQSIVLETAWNAVSPAAKALHATLQTSGSAPILLAEVEGVTVLRAIVSQEKCQQNFAQGGTLVVTWSAATDSDSEEAGMGAAAAFQQDFRAVATSFFVEPAPPGYTSG